MSPRRPCRSRFTSGQEFQATPRNFRHQRNLGGKESLSFPSKIGQTWVVFDVRTRRAVGMIKASAFQRQLVITERDVQSVQAQRASRARFHNRSGGTVACYLMLGTTRTPAFARGIRPRDYPHHVVKPDLGVS